jgi:hypothetical protein
MTARLLLVVCGLLSLADKPTVPGSCVQTLPADGAWSTYHMSIKIESQEINTNWTARSVGQATHQGKACRWIELQLNSDDPMFPNSTWRCLVPEAEFGEGKHPLGQAVKVWHKVEGQDAQTVDSIEAKDAIFGALIKGPEQNLKTEDAPEFIPWQKGDLSCSVVAGDSEFKINKVIPVQVHHRNFRHPDAPFSMGGVHWELKIGDGDQKQTIHVKLTLKDHGTDAKPQLPELGI